MKINTSFLALALTTVFFISCKKTDSAPKEEVAVTKNTLVGKPETASFNIEGMTCAMGCAKTIEKKLAETDGVQKATVDFDKKTATVEFDANKQTPEKLVEIVEAAADGKTYKVSDVKSSGNHSMLLDQEKIQDQEKKETKKKVKTTKTTTETKSGGCCSGKKHCSADEKKV